MIINEAQVLTSTDAVAFLPLRDFRAKLDDFANHFMTRNAGAENESAMGR